VKSADDFFPSIMRTFADTAQQDFSVVEGKLVKMDELLKSLGKFYGEPTLKPEEIFAIFANFMDSYQKAKVDIAKRREAAVKVSRKLQKALEAKAALELRGSETKPEPRVQDQQHFPFSVKKQNPIASIDTNIQSNPSGDDNKNPPGVWKTTEGVDNMLASLRKRKGFALHRRSMREKLQMQFVDTQDVL